MNGEENKLCSGCKKIKSKNNFSKAKDSHDGLQNYCKLCQVKAKKQWWKINREKAKKDRKIWGLAQVGKPCPTCGKKSKSVRGKCRYCNLRWAKVWRENNREKTRFISAKNSYLLKKEVLSAYGGKCECCGEKAFEFLSIDHINGGGNAHRKSIKKGSIYRWLKRNNYPKGFRVFCYNCNLARGFFGFCPHQKIKFPSNIDDLIKRRLSLSPRLKIN